MRQFKVLLYASEHREGNRREGLSLRERHVFAKADAAARAMVLADLRNFPWVRIDCIEERAVNRRLA
jgi:hypothetical protein